MSTLTFDSPMHTFNCCFINVHTYFFLHQFSLLLFGSPMSTFTFQFTNCPLSLFLSTYAHVHFFVHQCSLCFLNRQFSKFLGSWRPIRLISILEGYILKSLIEIDIDITYLENNQTFNSYYHIFSYIYIVIKHAPTYPHIQILSKPNNSCGLKSTARTTDS